MIQRKLTILSLVLIVVALLRPHTLAAKAAPEPLLVIVGLQFPVNNLRLADLKDAFLSQPTLVAGRRLIAINHPINTPMRSAFDHVMLGLDPAAVGRYWVDRRIRDEGKPPTTAPSAEIAIRIAASLAGAVTYGTRSMLNPKVKIVTVDGKTADQPDYAFR